MSERGEAKFLNDSSWMTDQNRVRKFFISSLVLWIWFLLSKINNVRNKDIDNSVTQKLFSEMKSIFFSLWLDVAKILFE